MSHAITLSAALRRRADESLLDYLYRLETTAEGIKDTRAQIQELTVRLREEEEAEAALAQLTTVIDQMTTGEAALIPAPVVEPSPTPVDAASPPPVAEATTEPPEDGEPAGPCRREQVRAYIAAHPWQTTAEIRQGLGFPPGTVSGAISTFKTFGEVEAHEGRYALKGTPLPEVAPAPAAAPDSPAPEPEAPATEPAPATPTHFVRIRDHVLALAPTEEVTSPQVSEALDISLATTRTYLSQLVKGGELHHVPGTGTSGTPMRFVREAPAPRPAAEAAAPEPAPSVAESPAPTPHLGAKMDPEEASAQPPLKAVEAELSAGRARFVAHLREHGPATAREVAQALTIPIGPAAANLKALVTLGHLAVLATEPHPLYGLPGTPVPGPRADERAQRPEAPAARPLEEVSPGRARVLAHVREHGPATARQVADALGLPVGPAASSLAALVTAKHLAVLTRDPVPLYGLPGTPVPKKPAAATVMAPSQEDLRQRVSENSATLLALFEPGQEYTEPQLAARVSFPLSHLRAALGSLIDSGQIMRVPGATPMARALYRLDRLELPAPQRDHLTAEGRMVEARLREVTDRNERDTVLNLMGRLGLPRHEVEEALAVLHAQGRLRWARVGTMALYTLAANMAEAAA